MQIATNKKEDSMSVPIRIDKEFYNSTKATAKKQMRTIPKQIEFWAKVGRTAIENPDLPGNFIEGILNSLEEPNEPTKFEFSKKE